MNRIKQYGRVKSVPDVELTCVCLVCSKPTGEVKNIKSTLIDPQDLKPDLKNHVRDGLCSSCQEESNAGHTIFYSDTRGCILTYEGDEKIKPEFRGKIIKIPEDKMDEIMGPRK